MTVTTTEFIAQNFANHVMTVLGISHAMKMETKFVCLDGAELSVIGVG